MQIIQYSDLKQRTSQASESLHIAATIDGFFMLELDTEQDKNTLLDVSYLEAFAKKVLDTPAETRKKYRSSDLGPLRISGFKELGTVEGANKGQPDGFEMYMLRQDELFSKPDEECLQYPPIVLSQYESLWRCFDTYATLAELILANLMELLTLNDTLLSGHDRQAPSATSFSFLRYPPSSDGGVNGGHIAHTDVGSLTVLSTTERGLQVIDNSTQNWTYVEIRPMTLCVQFGDALKYMSGGKVIPSLHRVVSDNGMRKATKYSMIYFLRPNLTTKLVGANGTECTYQEYHCNKVGAFMESKGEIISARKHIVLQDE